MPTIDINGVQLHYREHGEGSALLLVHGLGTGSADFAPMLPRLSRQHRVIAPCLRGFGESQRPPGPYSIPLLADDLRALLDALGIARCHVCGVSMGGAVVLQLAVDDPGRLSSLIVINSQPSFVIDTWKKRLLYLSRLWLTRLLGFERFGRLQARRNFPGPGFAELRGSLRGRYRNTPAAYFGMLRALAGWEVVDRLQRVQAPVLMIASEFDYTPPAEKRRFAALFRNARVEVIAGARHAVHLERSDEVADAVARFTAAVEVEGQQHDAAQHP